MTALLLALSLLAQPIPVETPEDAARLCESLARWARGGEELPGAPTHLALYEVWVPARGLPLAAWDEEEERLALGPAAVLSGAGGSLRVWAPDAGGGLPVRADRATMERLLSARAEGRLALRITFAPRLEDGEPPCTRIPGARAHTLEVTPLAWEWREGEEPIASGAPDDGRPSFSAAQGARPRVTVRADQASASGALRSRAPELERCYEAALARRPDLDGALVLELAPAAVPRLAADSAQDEQLSDCVRGAAADLRAPALSLVTIHFDLEPPATAQAR